MHFVENVDFVVFAFQSVKLHEPTDVSGVSAIEREAAKVPRSELSDRRLESLRPCHRGTSKSACSYRVLN